MTTTEPLPHIGDLIRHARRDLGLTQEALAEHSGVSVRAIADIERGVSRAPRRDTLALLAEALDIIPEERRRWEQLRRRLAISEPSGVSSISSETDLSPLQRVATASRTLEHSSAPLALSLPSKRSSEWPPLSQVFLSYSGADVEFARQTRAHLMAHGVRTWMDEFDVHIGAYLPDAMDDALQSSDVVIGVLSPDAVASRNVKNVWDWAMLHDKRLTLVLVKPTDIPHRYIALNRIDATGADPSSALHRLLTSLGVTPVDTGIPETRYTRIGDISIAYQVIGDGPLDLVYCSGFVSNVDVIWEEPRCAHFLRRLASFSRLILFDKRGTGASDRINRPTRLEERLEDVLAVMEAAGSRRAALMGNSEGAPLAIQFAATYPERVAALALYGSYACGVQMPDYPDGRTPEENEQELAFFRDHWGEESIMLVHSPGARDDPAYLRWVTRMARLSATPRDAVALSIVGSEIDVRHLLPLIRMPTLVIHRTGDHACKIGEGRYVAEHIPGAQFVELPGDDHTLYLGDSDAVIDQIRAFLSVTG